MSDNEDLLGDDLGDQSLADYNLGNEEEEQLLADDYEGGGPQNVPISLSDGYSESVEVVPPDYSRHGREYAPPPMQYQPVLDTECVVPNITVEVPNLPPHSTYAPIEPRHYESEHAVPLAIPAGPQESPQIVPSEVSMAVSNGEGTRERFVAERPVGAQRMPQVRDIPDSLVSQPSVVTDKVVIPRGGFPRGRTTWRSAHFNARFQHQHPYRRNNMHRGNFSQRNSFPPPQHIMRPNIPQQIIRQEIRQEMIRPDVRPEMMLPDIRPEINRPDIRPEMMRPDIRPVMMRPDIRTEMNRPDVRPQINRSDIRPEMSRPDVRPEMIRRDVLPEMNRPDIMQEMHRQEIRPDMPPNHQMGPEISPERPMLPDMSFRPQLERPPFPPFQRFQFRPEERPMFRSFRPNFDRPMYPYPRNPQFNPRFAPPTREIANSGHMPQVTIWQNPDKMPAKEPEVRMLPVPLPLPPHLPPGGLAGKKVLINPHFKGNFQPPVDGLPAYIPTRIQKSPPLSPTNKFGPVKDIDEAAERFIAEQKNALARAAGRKFPRRSPQRYIENTTIEIENELAPRATRRRSEDDDLLRRQEEFINANRAGLRRRMRSPSPAARRSPSPRRRPEPARPDEDSEYKRRLREQESLRERVLRAKEVRRRKNAVALHKQMQDRERETIDNRNQPQPKEKDNQTIATTTKDKEPEKPETTDKPSTTEVPKPDTTRKTPERKPVEGDKRMKPEKEKEIERARERSPVKAKDDEVNSTCEALTPPGRASPALTPPWPQDDDLDLILGDIDGILSDDDDSGRFKDKANSARPAAPAAGDLRARLPARDAAPARPARQKITFARREERDRRDKTPPRRAVVSSTKPDDSDATDRKPVKTKQKTAEMSSNKSRQRITFTSKEKETEKQKDKQEKTPPFSNRRVILQRKISKESIFSRMDSADKSQPNPGIFSRAIQTAIGDKKRDEPQIEFESDSDVDEDKLLNEDIGNLAVVGNLPHGMTDTRLRTLAGSDVQSLVLDKEERSAKITFKTTVAAESFKKKFNNKMVSASQLTVTLR